MKSAKPIKDYIDTEVDTVVKHGPADDDQEQLVTEM